ncbi:ribosome biogenesis protein ytm1 [Collariella sp. IMI 366227]|nr:ribosome biogenesis protein ytm1 [Collariella sp. IMI 366227]
MTTSDFSPTPLAQALVDFSLQGAFPEDTVSSLPLDSDSLPAAIKALADAKAKLQADIHAINEETADDVRTWQTNAQSVQDDILRSKALAAEIVKASEAPVVSGRAVDEIEAKADFLIRELNYNAQVLEALRGIKTVNQTLDAVERARDERRILEALHLLERSWKEMDRIGANKTCRAVKLLDIRAFELKSDVHDVFDYLWNSLINVDTENHRISISSAREDELMSLEDAVIGLKAYKEVDQRMSRLWEDINTAIIVPRMDITKESLPGIHIEEEWTENAPKVWLSKCREAALDSVRIKLSEGFGAPKRVEKVEKQMVSKTEGQQLVASGAMASNEDHGWGAWDDGENAAPEETAKGGENKPPEDDDDGTDAWGWGEEDAAAEETAEEPKEGKPDDDDDPSAAWGWGDEGNDEGEAPSKPPSTARVKLQTRELVLKEGYSITSMPQPVMDLIFSILEDGATLTRDTYADSPVATQAAGLFSLPTLTLAMFRAVSPYYYSPEIGGNMYLYNDSSYLAEQLSDFASAWKIRWDLTPRAQAMLRLDNDIKSLQSFATRAYTNELALQKTVLRDLLGGEQNLIQQDRTPAAVAPAVAHVRSLATAWEDILARSVWQQAVGGLVDAVAIKIIGDVMDLPSIGQDEAYDIAKMIAAVEELDEIFLPSRLQGNKGVDKEEGEVPVTAQFAGNWLRLKYLSEVLQSNLRDVRFLWVEGELSLYFTVEEVVDLVLVSFEDNVRTREVIREIRGNPRPLGEGRGQNVAKVTSEN